MPRGVILRCGLGINCRVAGKELPYKIEFTGLVDAASASASAFCCCSFSWSASPSMMVRLMLIRSSMFSVPRITAEECLDTQMEREMILARSWSGNWLPSVPQSEEKVDHMRRFQSKASTILASRMPRSFA